MVRPVRLSHSKNLFFVCFDSALGIYPNRAINFVFRSCIPKDGTYLKYIVDDPNPVFYSTENLFLQFAIA